MSLADFDVVTLSRLQFAITALYHFLFVPLTIGLSLILAICETVFVMTDREIWRKITQFWGVLFGINFAMGVATGITMEFQFGTNWSYFSHYVGDIFGVPLALEGLMAFFLEATFIGLFFFGWKKLSPLKHLMVTYLVALGSNLSALWILIANAWMQNPVGAHFNVATMRMELSSFSELFFNPVAQAKFVHTVSAGYVTGAMFVLSISAYYLLKKQHMELAKRSLIVAASFGLASALSVVVLGDESGYTATIHQRMKIAAIEAMWDTQKPPASLTLIGIPNQKEHTTEYAIEIPWVLGLVTTRSVDEEVKGINQLVTESEERIANGLKAYGALQILKKDAENKEAQLEFDTYVKDLGYALLLKKFMADPLQATQDDIERAAKMTIPQVLPLFFSFRIMAGLGFYFIGLFGLAFYFASKREFEKRWFLKLAFYSLPLPWVASELGWVIAEYGRQPWAIEGVLPTFLAVSNNPASHVLGSLIGFIFFYSVLAIVDVILMRRAILQGPDMAKAEY